MAVEEKLALEGQVEESLPNLMFRVTLDNGHSVLAHMAGRMRRARIRVNPGDRVRVEVAGAEPAARAGATALSARPAVDAQPLAVSAADQRGAPG